MMPETYFSSDSQYETLKREVFVFASHQLKTSNPHFVEEFQRELLRTSDFRSAYTQFEHLLGHGRQPWRDLLTTVFEVDMVARKATEALTRMSAAVNDERKGEFFYHVDHWLFQIDALFDRCEGTVKKASRTVLKPVDASFKVFEQTCTSELNDLRHKISLQRNKLAHGLGGGVSGISVWWDGYLSIPGLEFTTTRQLADTILEGVSDSPTVETRARWYAGLSGETARSLAGVDAICGRVASAIARVQQESSRGCMESGETETGIAVPSAK